MHWLLLYALCGLILATEVFSVPTESSDGICAIYVVQSGDTCKSIAKANGITVADIKKYNMKTLDWDGCDGEDEGKFICLSSGEPPMPVALPQAVCGPQVPGTARPSNWSVLASLNPCPSDECCMMGGSCTSGDSCSLGRCLSNCPSTAKTTRATQTAAKKGTTAPSLTETTKTTMKVEATTKAEPATTTKQGRTTTTSEAPRWTMVAYFDTECDSTDNYYILEGPSSSKCVNIRKGGFSEYSDDGILCRYYSDGGFTTTSCDNIPETDVWSHILTGGTCIVYTENCGSSNGGQSQLIESYQMCSTVSTQSGWGLATTWRSMRCTVTGD